jgi:hypothetical protein
VNDGYLWWFILVGAVIALAVVWVVAARLPRDEADVSEDERRAEAAWISETIERYGGVAPQDLVEEVLELHAGYLASPRLARVPEPAALVPTAGPPPLPEGDPPAVATPGSSLAGAPRVVSGPPLPPPVPPPPLGRVERRPPPAPPR